MAFGCLPAANPLWQCSVLRFTHFQHWMPPSPLQYAEGQEVVREMEVDILAFILQRLSADGGLAAEFLSHPLLPALLQQAAGTTASDKKVRATGRQFGCLARE